MRRVIRSSLILVITGSAIAVSAIASAIRSPFVDLDEVQATVGQQTTSEAPAAVDPSANLDAASLQAVADLAPFEWPWFADGVQTPPDAVAQGADLVEAMSRIPGLANYKVLSAERTFYPGTLDVQALRAWLKVSDTELLRVGTRLVTADVIIPQDYTNVVAYAGGTAQYRFEARRINVILVVGDRMVSVDAVLTNGSNGRLSLTPDDLLGMAAAIIETLGAAVP